MYKAILESEYELSPITQNTSLLAEWIKLKKSDQI